MLAVLRGLAEGGEWRQVIRLVESWAAGEPVPTEALLLEARAFFELRLMDRAWVRLREVTEADPEHAEALALTARMFVERGWPGRARKVVERLRAVVPDHPELDELDRLCHAPAVGLPEDAAAIAETGSADARLALAERYLATGSVIRARSLLERLRRSGEHARRVDDLLWGIAGDFTGGVGSLDAILDEVADRRASDWETPEHTESIDPDTGLPEDEDEALPEGPSAFPTLFRRPPAVAREATEPLADDEITVASVLSGAGGPGEEPTGERTEASGFDETDGSGDTQIMQVISRAEGRSLVAAEEEPPAPERPLDLRALRSSRLGDAEAGEDEDFLEEEDQDLVVVVRREEQPEPPTEPEPRRAPIEVIEKVPVPEARVVEDDLEPDIVEDFHARGRQVRRLVAGALVLLVVLGGAVLGGLKFVAATAGSDIVRTVHAELARGDFRVLVRRERGLADDVTARRIPLGARAAELALVRAVLWAEYTGDPRQVESLDELGRLVPDKGRPAREFALARGIVAWMRGDLPAAREALAAAEPGDPETRLLAARVALADAGVDAAREAWGRYEGDGLRYRVFEAGLLDRVGGEDRQRAGRALVSELGTEAPVFIAAQERGWTDEGPEARLAAIDRFLQERRDVLSPRQVGRLYAARADLLDALDRSEDALRALQRAQAADPTHPGHLYRLGVAELVAGRSTAASRRLVRCLELYPFQPACTRGEVQVLLDLDRVERARLVVDRWKEAGLPPTVAEARLRVAEGRPGAAVDLASAALAGTGGRPAPEGPVAGRWYHVLGLALGEQDHPELARKALRRAEPLLRRSRDPLDRLLERRLAAAEVLYAESLPDRRTLHEVAGRVGEDPVAQVLLARAYLAANRRAAAAQFFQEAAARGTENALALFWAGWFNHAVRHDDARARAIWRRYLDLGPSGPRRAQVEASGLVPGAAGKGRP